MNQQEKIEIFDNFDIDPNHFKEIMKEFTPKRLTTKPFDLILNMKRLNDQYHITESAYYASIYLYWNVKPEEVIKYYSYYQALRMLF